MKVARLTHEAYDEKQTIEFDAQCDIHEYLDQIERLLVAASFHPESVKDGFIAKAYEIELSKAEEDVANEENLHTD